jgi:hypothetical protein
VIGSAVVLPEETSGHVSHGDLAIYTKKYLKAKEEELWKLKYFTMQKYTKPSKNPLKETKILQVSNTSQNIIFQKSSYNKNRPIIIIIT